MSWIMSIAAGLAIGYFIYQMVVSKNGGVKTTGRIHKSVKDKKIAGVCSGLAMFLDVDVTLVRILMLCALIFGTAGFWIYIILWIVMQPADTPAKKCEMRGLYPTPENMSRFTYNYR